MLGSFRTGTAFRKDATKSPPTRLWQRGVHRTRAHASAPKRTLPSWPNAAPSEFPQALPEGEVLARLRRSIRKPVGDDSSGNPL